MVAKRSKKSTIPILDSWERWNKQKANARYNAERRRNVDKVVKAVFDKIISLFKRKK